MNTPVMRVLGAIYCWSVLSFLLTMGVLGFLAACASSSDHPDWIRTGVTTKADVIARYGQPDLLRVTAGGDTAIYHPTASAPRLKIPTFQAAPSGQFATRMQPVDPGLGTKHLDAGANERVSREIHIRYDVQGVVQELSQFLILSP